MVFQQSPHKQFGQCERSYFSLKSCQRPSSLQVAIIIKNTTETKKNNKFDRRNKKYL